MTLIKYYEIESSYQGFLSSLERGLEKDAKFSVLDGNHTRNLSVGDSKYDSGNFIVLYLKSEKLKGWRFEKQDKIGRVLSKRAGLELVVKGDEDNIGFLDDYLEESTYEVIQANEVHYASFSFMTYPYTKNTKKVGNFLPKVCNYIEFRRLDLERRFSVENYAYRKIKGILCSGLIVGGVEDVLEIRDFILNRSYGVEIDNEVIKFKQDKPICLFRNNLLE